MIRRRTRKRNGVEWKKVGSTVGRGARAIGRGAKAVGRGTVKAARYAAPRIKRAAKATARGTGRAAQWVGKKLEAAGRKRNGLSTFTVSIARKLNGGVSAHVYKGHTGKKPAEVFATVIQARDVTSAKREARTILAWWKARHGENKGRKSNPSSALQSQLDKLTARDWSEVRKAVKSMRRGDEEIIVLSIGYVDVGRNNAGKAYLSINPFGFVTSDYWPKGRKSNPRRGAKRVKRTVRRRNGGTIRGTKALGVRLHQWHSGQGDPIYGVGSMFYAGKPASVDAVEDAVSNLRRSRTGVVGKDRKALDSLIATMERKLEKARGRKANRGTRKPAKSLGARRRNGLEFYAHDPKSKRAWRFRASEAWYRRNDNGHAVSIGFTVGEDITLRKLKALNATEVPYDEWNHSGCQSSCVKRGDKSCRW